MTTPAPLAPARRRRNLTYREKLAIVQKKEDEPSWTQRSLALWAKEQFRLESKPTQATISNLLRAKHKLQLLASAVPPDFRSARRVRHPELDRRVLLWVHDELQARGPVTRLAIQHRAMDLAREMQLPADLSFSKGWVSSFISRHQLSIGRRGDAPAQQQQMMQMQSVRQEPTLVEETPAVAVEEEKEEEEEEEEEEEVDHSVEVEQEQVQEEEVEQEGGSDSTPMQSERRGDEDWNSGREEGRATTDLLLDWVAVPGSYSRWWLLKEEKEKEPLCGEINLFLRSHGLRGMSSADIKQQLSTFVMTFQAAHMWLRQTRVEYPLDVEEMTLEQEGIKSHVRQMCPHYERLAPVLAAYVKYDDNAADMAQSSAAPVTATIEAATQVSSEAASSSRTDDTSAVATTPPRPAKRARRQSTESTADDSIEDETKAQKRRLFELECARLQSEIETRNIQLVLEKTLARKKLLDAGISAEENLSFFGNSASRPLPDYFSWYLLAS
ncbi:hypothetical protein PR002_g24650 [Phytophthora rubi]|uniref:HTH CENPB-type domain-containing protein n=1 Tax=Phytophthora rubi TaxID=129364 RepID=A0A6A3I9W6_9STRA|nr:hypothetical protein PR002_g24650 [Phytophthora rubi]